MSTFDTGAPAAVLGLAPCPWTAGSAKVIRGNYYSTTRPGQASNVSAERAQTNKRDVLRSGTVAWGRQSNAACRGAWCVVRGGQIRSAKLVLLGNAPPQHKQH
jgi:hypothetical protein